MAISLLGIGTVCALGNGTSSFKKGLRGENCPNIEMVPVHLKKGDVELPVYRPVVEGLDHFITKKATRRLDSFAKMTLLSTYLCLEDAGMNLTNRSRVGIVFGSSYGPIRTTFKFLDRIIEGGDSYVSPTLFANSVHNVLASQISIFLKITGPCSTVTCFKHTLSNVLLTAQDWLNEGVVDYVIAGIGEEYCDVLGYYVAGRHGDQVTPLNPPKFNQYTYSPGEGCVTFLLGSGENKNPKYCVIESPEGVKSIQEVREAADNADSVILAANGNSDEGDSYNRLNLKSAKTIYYSQLYGSMPSGAAFDLAAAALQDEVKNICCIEYTQKDEFNVFKISK